MLRREVWYVPVPRVSSSRKLFPAQSQYIPARVRGWAIALAEDTCLGPVSRAALEDPVFRSIQKVSLWSSDDPKWAGRTGTHAYKRTTALTSAPDLSAHERSRSGAGYHRPLQGHMNPIVTAYVRFAYRTTAIGARRLSSASDWIVRRCRSTWLYVIWIPLFFQRRLTPSPRLAQVMEST